ncbi:MAG: sugar ABC transporter ATP-binding protein, partial [Verrucomicrobiota bacterium]
MTASSPPLLEMTGIDKSFPGVRALSNVNLTLNRGEILALLGENGAGKSTLIKMLGGAHRPDAGRIVIDGEEVDISSPHDSIRQGIGIIYQEFNLVPALSAWENIFLGREQSTAGFVHRRDERKQAIELFERIGVEVPVDAPCGRLSVARQQIVEIAKALSQDVRFIVMDEPSAALTPQEVEHLFGIIRELQKQRIGIIYISHRLDEIFDIADRVMVLRDGEYAGDAPIEEMTRQKMIEMMVGRTIENEFPKHYHDTGEVRLKVTGLNRGEAVRDVGFEVRS